MIRKMNPKDLKPHPLNEQIYGVEPVDLDLVESIKKHGLLENLVIKQDGTIISGHRRWLAVLELHPKHIKNVACEIIGFPGGEDGQLLEEERLLESNRQRKKTDVQLANEGNLLEKIYNKQAELRKLANLKQNNLDENETTEGDHIGTSVNDQKATVVPNLSTTEEKNQLGRTRAKVAKDLGIGEESYRKLKKLRKASESDDQVIAQIADRLLKDPMTKNRKYNLFLNFMKIYHECNNKNPKISEYATNMVSDIYGRFIKIEDAHHELSNYIKALESKEKALKNEYPSDDYESDSKEYIEDESAMSEKQNKPSNILRAKPVESNKPKVSPKYQALLDAVKSERAYVAMHAESLIKQIDNGEITADKAYNSLKEKIREVNRIEKELKENPKETKELERSEVSRKDPFVFGIKHDNPEVSWLAKSLRLKVEHGEISNDEAENIVKEKIRELNRIKRAQREMMKVPKEPGEILEKESERPISSSSKMERPKDQNNVDTPVENIPSTLEKKNYEWLQKATKHSFYNYDDGTYSQKQIEFAKLLLKDVDSGKLNINEAWQQHRNKSKEYAQRIRMQNMSEESNEKPKCIQKCDKCNLKPDNCVGHGPGTFFSAQGCNTSLEYKAKNRDPKICVGCHVYHDLEGCALENFDDEVKDLVKHSMDAAKNKGEWSMADHLLLNKVLVELKSS